MKKLTIALAISFSLLCTSPVLAQAPTLINFQGKLTDAAQAPVNGPAEVVFSIYDAAGSLLWSEHHNNVEVKKAIFNILLGSGKPNGAPEYPPLADILAANTEAWLEVQILDKTKIPLTWETMSPRQRLVSVAYSLHAQTAVDVPGMNINPKSVTIPGVGQVIDSSGHWTGVAIPSDKLKEEDPQVGPNTENHVPKWKGSALVDSTSIFESAAGNVGINTNNPTEKLTVEGTIKTDGIVFNNAPQSTAFTGEKDPFVPQAIKDIIVDGKIDLLTEVQGVHASLKDGIIWDEIADKPTSFGITKEDDPQVGNLTANSIPKWDGGTGVLVDSTSINETADGKVGIGIPSPTEKLHVAGNITATQDVSASKMTASTSMSTPLITAKYASLDKAQLNTVVTEGTACSSNGLIARDSSGLVLSCQSGKWHKQSPGISFTETGGPESFYPAGTDKDEVTYHCLIKEFSYEETSMLGVTLRGQGISNQANFSEITVSIRVNGETKSSNYQKAHSGGGFYSSTSLIWPINAGVNTVRLCVGERAISDFNLDYSIVVIN